MNTARSLVVAGGVLEFAGIILVASPDLIPYATEASRWLRDAYRRTLNRALRMIGRPRDLVLDVFPAGAIASAGRISAIKFVGEDATLERKLAFLLQRDQEAQQAENRLTERLDDLGQGTAERLGEVRSELKDHFAEKLAEELTRYRPLRVGGTVLLFMGLGCTVAASFVI